MKDRLAIFILAVILALIYWQWFLPGPRVANDFQLISSSLLKSSLDFPRTWSELGAEGLGEYTAFFLWSWPLSFVSGLLGSIDLTFVIIERIIIVLFLFIGAFGIWKICENINISNSTKFIACLFYLINTYIFLIIDGGQLSIVLAYAWFPVSFLAIEKSINGGGNRMILAGLSTAVLGFFDFRFIYILFLISLIYFLYQFLYLNRKKWLPWILDWIASWVIIGFIVAGLNFYWLFPLIKAPIQQGTYTFFTQVSFPSFTSLGHSMLMLAPHWYKNIFGNVIPLRFEFIFIPILVFLAPILRPKDRQVGLWVLIALISIFLTKGSSEPFSRVYPWFFSNIPGFSLFRDSTKFFFLTALSYSVLLAITSDEIIKRLKKFSKLRVVFLFSLILYLIFLIRPVWLADMTGTFLKPPLQKEYSQLANFLENDRTFSRVFWIPTLAPLGYSSLEHPRVEAARLAQKRTFAQATLGTYEIFNYLREAPYMGEIFDIAGIGYIVYPNLDPRRDNLHPDNIKYYYTFSDQLSKLPWLSKISDSPISLWRVNKHQDKFFVTPNVWVVIGSDSITDLKLSKNALIFVEEYPGLGQRIDQLPEAKIVLNNKTFIDLSASFIEPSQLIFPARQLNADPDSSGWWKREAKDLIRWRDFLQTKYGIDNQDFDLGGGWAIAEKSLKLKVQSAKFKKDNILLARVLESTRSGQLKFYQDDKLVGQIETNRSGNNVRWFEIGKLFKDKELEIISEGDINVVNALAILDKDEWFKLQNKAQSLQSRVSDFDAKNTRQAESLVKYQQINPTKYKVTINNLTGPSFLVFSQTYHNLWKIDGQSALPVYSLVNGFRIEKDGEYIVEFEAQRYIYPGLIISLLTILIIISVLLQYKYKYPKVRI